MPNSREEILRACAVGPADNAIALLSECTEADRPSIHELCRVLVENDQVETFRYALQSEDLVFARDVDIAKIISKRSRPLIEVLLDRGWDINMNLGGYKGCALTWALIQRAPKDFVEWLLDHGADPNGPYGGADHLGHSLRLAVGGAFDDRDEEKDFDLAKLLLTRGADVNESRALHRAAERGNFPVVKLLVEDPWRADVNLGDHNPSWAHDKRVGKPLHCAVMSGKVEIVEYLLGKGADVSGKDSQGSTPREVAEMNGRQAMVAVLQQWEKA